MPCEQSNRSFTFLNFSHHLVKHLSPGFLCAFTFNKGFRNFNIFPFGKFRQLRELCFNAHHLAFLVFGRFSCVEKVFNHSFVVSCLWPQSAGLKIGFVFRRRRKGKNWISRICGMNCFAIPNRRLLSKKVGWDWSGEWRIVAENQHKISPARERSERVHSSENSQCLTWSQLLNEGRPYLERTCPAPRLRPPDGGAKQNIFLFFQFWRATLFPLKGIEKCFALLLLTEQESGAAPTPVPLRGMAGGQKFLPPNPLPFCPPAGNPQRIFRVAGPQIGWWVGLVFFQNGISSGFILSSSSVSFEMSRDPFCFKKFSTISKSVGI